MVRNASVLSISHDQERTEDIWQDIRRSKGRPLDPECNENLAKDGKWHVIARTLRNDLEDTPATTNRTYREEIHVLSILENRLVRKARRRWWSFVDADLEAFQYVRIFGRKGEDENRMG